MEKKLLKNRSSLKIARFNKMKLFCFNLILLFSFKTYGQCDTCHSLTVEKYRISTFGGNYIKPITRLEERRKYSKNGNIIYQINYHGEFSDSIKYSYRKNEIANIVRYKCFTNGSTLTELENINYKYKNSQVEDVEVIKTEYTDLPKEFYLNQLPNFNKYNFKDPLNLLNNNFSNINFNDFKNTKVSYIKDGSKILIKKKYIVNSITPVLYEYGIPHDAFLETINLYSTDKLMLLKDEFIFDNLIVTRNYRYLDSLINSSCQIKW